MADCCFWVSSEASPPSVVWAKLLWIGTFENFKCSTMLSGQWRSRSQSPLLKLPSRTVSLELCTWTVQKTGYWFLLRSPLSFLVLFNILTEFQNPQTVAAEDSSYDFMLFIWFLQATSFLCPCQHYKERSRLRRFAKRQKQFHSNLKKIWPFHIQKISLK